ncbi:MAG TPA: hypothetical protein VF039_00960 [Longimicrobiales bacterium]
MSSKLRVFPLFALVAWLGVAACDDPSNPDPDPDPDPIGEEISPDERMEAFGAIHAELEALIAAHDDPAAQNEAIAAYLETRAEFREVGVDSAASTVWAVFTDGRGLIIPNNLRLGVDSFDVAASRAAPAPVPAALARARAYHDRAAVRSAAGGASLAGAANLAWNATEMPTATRARLVHSFSAGTAFGDGAAQAIGRIRPLLEEAGWSVVTGGASVAELRAITGGDGYFYINTHGGPGATWDNVRLPTFALQTGTVVTLFGETDSLTDADLDAGRLVYMWGDYDGSADNIIPRIDLRYAITPKFVQHYMSFAPGAVVILNACYSGNPKAEPNDMVQAFRSKGASVVLGWTQLVNAYDAWHAAAYLTDRLAGANMYHAETSLHRPFGLDPVLEHMADENIDKSNGGYLRAIGPTSGAGFGILRPTIERLVMDTAMIPAGGLPFGALTVHGTFGADPGAANRRVFVRAGGEHALQVLRWSPDSLKVMPATDPLDPGFVGDVVVEVRGIESNPRRLNGWLSVARYTMATEGTLQYEIEMEIAGRFDVDSIREKPGEAPRPNHDVHVFRSLPYPELEARWNASGEAVLDDCTLVWSGSETILSTEPSSDESYIFHAEFDPARQKITVRSMQVSDVTGYSQTCGAGQGGISFTLLQYATGQSDIYQEFDVSDAWNLQTRTLTIGADPTTLTFRWPDAAPLLDVNVEQPR